MTRWRWIAVGAVMSLAVLAYSVRPGTLSIRLPDTPWRSVAVTSPFGKTVSFPSGAPIKLWPVQYGRYKVCVNFADGKSAWLEYCHYDAGVRKRAEMVIQRLPDGDTLRVTQTYNGSETVEGTVSISKTSRDAPLHIDGPAG